MSAARVEYYQDSKGEWRWRSVASNGETIADSAEGYVHRGDCEDGYAATLASGGE